MFVPGGKQRSCLLLQFFGMARRSDKTYKPTFLATFVKRTKQSLRKNKTKQRN